MRANIENKSIDMEARDINYILSAYIRSYLFVSKNEDPERIIFPMFLSVPHPTKPGVQVPIDWLPPIDPKVTEIAEDGKDVAEVTSEHEAALDAQDEAVKELKEQAAGTSQQGGNATVVEVKEAESKKPEVADVKTSTERIKKAADREPKMPPGGDLGTGHPDGMGSRDARLDRKIAQDLKPEAKVDESKELPKDIEKSSEQ